MGLQPIETNLFDFFIELDIPVIDRRVEDDVCWYTSDVPFPLLNGALKARFAPQDAVRRTHEVLDRLIDHGNPFLWWLTPNTRSDDLEQVLAERGLVADHPNNAMSVDLRTASVLGEQPPAGVTLEPMTDANVDELVLAMIDGFGMPHDLLEPFRTLFRAEATDRVALHNVLARLDGEPVGAGSVVVSDRSVAGLYNIAVREQARGRGVGRAVTVALMRIGAQHGCSESILHASQMGEPVYANLGYRIVGQVAQYLWMPDGAPDKPPA
jgi:GNAT superfamily N-acetyltransferase